jgi:UDP-N-acetylmuramyl pentapeptide phosphotransferase/UDP-N-acetylglucosamine-1-phosphate transferase
MLNYFLSFFGAAIISLIAIPSIIRVAYLKHLYDEPDDRKTHERVIPTLGGLAIFAGFTIAYSLFVPTHGNIDFKYIIAAILIIFFIGIKDDILITVPLKKLLGQLLAVSIVVVIGGVRLTSMYGLFGIFEIDEIWGVSLTIFTLLTIMNGFNLIDGVNWLSGGVGVVVSASFGLWFYLNGFETETVMCLSLMGALFGFLWFNKTPAQIFMGDTGSLIIGLITGIMCVKFIELNSDATEVYFNSVPLIAFGVLIVPLFDTLRVFTWRLLKGKSPLHPDRNHIHHRLLEVGLNHMQTSLLIMFTNILFVVMVYFAQGIGSIPLLLLELFVAAVLSYIPSIILRKKHSNEDDEQNNEGGQVVELKSISKVGS